MVCAIPGEVEEGERHHIMANHGDIQPASVAALRRRAGGSIFVRTGNHGNGVDRMVPEMRRMEECIWASTRLTCVERCHTGATVFCHRVTQSQRR